MKKILLGTVALAALGLAAPAVAADIPAKAPMYSKAPAMVALYNWTGFYIGAQVGGAWSNNHYADLGAGTATSYNGNGLFVGGRTGYNWQMAPNWVIGFQGDLNWANINGNDGGFGGATDTTKIQWNASIVGRLGWATNNVLLYGLGGIAFAGIEQERVLGATVERPRQTFTGWTAGAGIELGLTPNWTANAEYRYTDYGRRQFTYVAFTSPVNVDVRTHSVSVGVSYKFGGPLVARY
jgi:outer membrane immunogenic protein